jgi:hypothetical protein
MAWATGLEPASVGLRRPLPIRLDYAQKAKAPWPFLAQGACSVSKFFELSLRAHPHEPAHRAANHSHD